MKSSAMRQSGRVAAFFDLDGTLLPGPSLEWRFAEYLLRNDAIPSGNIFRWLLHSVNEAMGNPGHAFRANKSYLAGLRESLAKDWERTLESSPLPFFASGLNRIGWHLGQRHAVVLASGTLDPLARIAARAISEEAEVLATKLEACDGYWTGFLAGEHRRGREKAAAMEALATERGFDLARSFAYGDEMADLSMLKAVGHPAAVNPTGRLERVARQHGWRIYDWRRVRERGRAKQPAAGNHMLWPRVAR